MRNTYRGVTEDTPSDVEDSRATKLPRSPHKIEERRLDPDNDEDDDAQAHAAPFRPNLKRKHSLTTGSTSEAPSPAAVADQTGEISFVAPLPMLVPPPGPLPSSDFEFYATRGHPVTRHGYRYTTCGPSPSSQLPIPIQRLIENVPQSARFSWEDRSAFAFMTEDARTITAEKGWRSARANVGLREGNWYWEIKAHRCGGEGSRSDGGTGEGSWLRIGVGRREAQLNAPCGYDGYSYAYRDRNGEAVTLSRPLDYGQAYKSGSTIGVYISLPPRPPPVDRRDPARIVRKRLPIRYKGQLYFEALEYAPTKEMDELAIDPATKAKEVIEDKVKTAPGKKVPAPANDLESPLRELPVLDKAKIAFFVDGVCQGVAYENIYDYIPLKLHANGRERMERKKADVRSNWHDDGTLGYYPHVSVFGGAIATMNAGPDFDFPPPDNIEAALKASPIPPRSGPLVDEATKREGRKRNWRPLCERYAEYLAEQALLDDLDEQEAIRVFAEQSQKAADQAAAMSHARGAGYARGHGSEQHANDYDRIPVPTKRPRHGRLEELDVVKREEVVSVQGTPGQSPKPEESGNESREGSMGVGIGGSSSSLSVPEEVMVV